LDQYKIPRDACGGPENLLRHAHGILKKFSKKCWAQASCLSLLGVKNGPDTACAWTSARARAHGVLGTPSI